MLGKLQMNIDTAISLYDTFLNRFLKKPENFVTRDLSNAEESDLGKLDFALSEMIRKGSWSLNAAVLSEVSVARCNGSVFSRIIVF
jgi:hypothetical protein